MAEDVEWLREDFRDEWENLLSVAEITAEAGLTSSGFSLWRKDSAFPQPVCRKKPEAGGKPILYFARSEVAPRIEKAKAKLHTPEAAERYKSTRREKDEDERQVQFLTSQESDIQSQLARIRAEKKRRQKNIIRVTPFVTAYEREHGISPKGGI
ncbi:hypothetical protein AB0H73_06375 [Streptomyces olivoreticuli]